VLPFVWGIARIRRDTRDRKASKFVFLYSLLYLALLFAAMAVDLHVMR